MKKCGRLPLPAPPGFPAVATGMNSIVRSRDPAHPRKKKDRTVSPLARGLHARHSLRRAPCPGPVPCRHWLLTLGFLS